MARSNYWIKKANSSRLSRRRFMGGAAVAGAGAGAFALVGCGDDDDDDDDSSEPTATSASGEPTTAATGEASASATAPPSGMTPQDGSHFIVIGSSDTFTSVDPHREAYPGPSEEFAVAYSNLIVYDDATLGTLRGDLATGMPEQTDELTFVFEIFPDVPSHPKPPTDGRALTSEDVAWNINRQVEGVDFSGNPTPFYRRALIYGPVVEAEAVDATHVKVTLDSPFAPWLTAMGDQLNNLIFPEVAELIDGDLNRPNPDWIVGTGPYMFTQFEPNKRDQVTRFPDYFRKAKGEPTQFVDDAVWVNLGTDANAQQAAFLQKQIDSYTSPSPELLNAVAEQAGFDVEDIIENPNPNTHTIPLYNTTRPPFDNPMLRQAVNLAVDRQAVLQIVYGGLGRANAAVPWPFVGWTIPPEELNTWGGYRTDEAEREEDLKEARALWEAGGGYELGNIGLGLIEGAASLEQSVWWPGMLNDGLDTDQFSTFVIPLQGVLNYLASDDFENLLVGLPTWNSIDPRTRVRDGYVDLEGQVNFQNYSNPEVNVLVEESLREFELEPAQELIKEAQRLLHADGGGGTWAMSGSVDRIVQWPYFHREYAFLGFDGILWQRAWIDQDDPSFAGRASL